MPTGALGKPIIMCPGCNEEKQHHAKGFCTRCYNHDYRRQNPDKVRVYRRRDRERHGVRIRAYFQKWRDKNRDKVRAWNRAWGRENPQKRQVIKARYHARKRALPDTLTSEEARQLFCVGEATYPGQKLHLDHVVPVSKGGGTTLANMHAVPASINQSKRDALPQDAYNQKEIWDGD